MVTSDCCLVAPRHVGSSWTRGQTRVPCTGRRILIHCATREVLLIHFNANGPKWFFELYVVVVVVVRSRSRVRLFVTPWTAACQASLSITNSQILLRLMSIESVMPSNHLIFCHPLLLLPSIFPSIRVFSKSK